MLQGHTYYGVWDLFVFNNEVSGLCVGAAALRGYLACHMSWASTRMQVSYDHVPKAPSM